jgi:hypothetical protein
MPSDHGLGLHDRQSRGPLRPHLSQDDPEEAIQPGQHWATSFALEYCHLLPQRQDFKGNIHATAEKDANGGQQRQDQGEHTQ